MAPRTDFPPVRACLFDMDGLLLDTEDLYTLCINMVLAKYGRPNLPWSIKAKLQGRPAPQSNAIFSEWAQLPVTNAEYQAELAALQQEHFPTTQPLPGVVQLLADLGRTRYWDTSAAKDKSGPDNRNRRVHIALATSSHANNFRLKTTHLTDLFSVFPVERRVLGDDKRVGPGRGKPLPDIYHLALSTINAGLAPGEAPIKPEECLVFEDSVPGVESGRRAGMRVVWVPHPMLKQEYAGREAEVLAGRMNEAADENRHGGNADDDAHLGELHDGWAEYLESLVDFPYEKYGIAIPPPEVEAEPEMQEAAKEPVAADESVKN